MAPVICLASDDELRLATREWPKEREGEEEGESNRERERDPEWDNKQRQVRNETADCRLQHASRLSCWQSTSDFRHWTPALPTANCTTNSHSALPTLPGTPHSMS